MQDLVNLVCSGFRHQKVNRPDHIQRPVWLPQPALRLFVIPEHSICMLSYLLKAEDAIGLDQRQNTALSSTAIQAAPRPDNLMDFLVAETPLAKLVDLVQAYRQLMFLLDCTRRSRHEPSFRQLPINIGANGTKGKALGKPLYSCLGLG